MINNNKIMIPWYNRNIKYVGDNFETNNSTAFKIPPFRTPKTRGGGRQPNPETVREPATSPVRSPVPSFSPNPNPTHTSDPTFDPLNLPFPDSFPTPFPIPPRPEQKDKKNPFLPKGAFPNPAITALPNMIPVEIPNFNLFDYPAPDNTDLRNKFITQIELAAKVSGVAASQIYNFVSIYDYENMTLSDFRSNAKEEFGTLAATVLTALVAGKTLVNLWGKRATMMFSPILSDDFIKQYFKQDEVI